MISFKWFIYIITASYISAGFYLEYKRIKQKAKNEKALEELLRNNPEMAKRTADFAEMLKKTGYKIKDFKLYVEKRN